MSWCYFANSFLSSLNLIFFVRALALSLTVSLASVVQLDFLSCGCSIGFCLLGINTWCNIRSDIVKYALIGLMRDLREITIAKNRLVSLASIGFLHIMLLILSIFLLWLSLCHWFFLLFFHCRKTYGFLFYWLYPAQTPPLKSHITLVWCTKGNVQL